jgi:hypothetical protein
VRIYKLLAVLGFVLAWWTSPLAGQTTTTLQWDFLGATPAVVLTWQQTVTIDSVPQTGAITCAPRVGSPADTSCAIPIAPLAPGPHTISILASANGQTAEVRITGVDPAKLPKSATSPRVTVLVTITL